MNAISPLQTVKVLLIDDSESDYLLTRRLLNRNGSQHFNLEWISDYQTGLQAIGREAHDVYLIDYNLSPGDGLGLVESARQQGCQKPLIILTGQGEREVDLLAMERGASDYLVKGEFTSAMLERTIRYAVERTRTLQELQQSEIRYRELFEALRQSEIRYRGVVNAQVELVCRYRPNGTLTFVNPAFCRFTNRSREDLIGTSREELLPPPLRADFRQMLSELSKTKGIVANEMEVATETGKTVWIQWTNQAILDGEDSIYEIQSVGQDITVLKKAQTELERALDAEKELSELKSRFVSMASHEFKTPLATIMSTASFLMMAGSDLKPEAQRPRLQKIKTAAHNMNMLLEDVLTFGYIDTVSFECTPKELEIISYCRHFVEDIQSTAPDHHIQITTNCPQAHILVDERLFHHILSNLLSNAIKYSPSGSVVDLELNIHADNLYLRVTDEGIGIPESDQEHLFVPFHRGLNVNNIAGTGLGLTITNEAVVAHGGTLSWQSQLGQGTTFEVTIPLEQS